MFTRGSSQFPVVPGFVPFQNSGRQELLLEEGRVAGLRFEGDSGEEELRGTVVLTSGGRGRKVEPTLFGCEEG